MKKPYRQPSKFRRVLTFCIYIVPALLLFMVWLVMQAFGIDDEEGLDHD